MKLILTGGIALCAVTLFAAEPQEKPNTTETVIAAPAPVEVQDSPLVRAAKATGRLQKKPTNVITNDTLLKTGGHFTTTKSQSPLPPIPEAPPAVVQPRMSAMERQKQEAAAKAKKEAAAERKAAARRADADFNDDSIEPRYEDPAMQEHMMQQGAQPTTTTAQPPKPPGL
jgi:hypothetical protein